MFFLDNAALMSSKSRGLRLSSSSSSCAERSEAPFFFGAGGRRASQRINVSLVVARILVFLRLARFAHSPVVLSVVVVVWRPRPILSRFGTGGLRSKRGQAGKQRERIGSLWERARRQAGGKWWSGHCGCHRKKHTVRKRERERERKGRRVGIQCGGRQKATRHIWSTGKMSHLHLLA